MNKIAIIFSIIAMLMLSGCKTIKEKIALDKKLDNLKIYYDGSKITWDDVSKAEYVITINEQEYEAVKSEFGYKATSSFDFFLTVKVDGKEERSYKKHFAMLPTVSNLTSQDNVITWDSVSEASCYAVKINGVVIDTNVALNEYAITTTGHVEVAVKAVSDNINSFANWSESLSLIILDQPKNITYDFKKEEISWDKVASATSYSVLINNELIQTTNNYISVNDKNEITVKVRANSIDAVSSNYSSEYKFKYFEPVKNIQVNNGILKWESEASSFYIDVNGEVFFHNQTILENLEASKEYNIKIYPYISDEYHSNWETIPTFTILEKPNVVCDVLAFSEIISWESVANSDTYQIKISANSDVIYNNEDVKANAFYIGSICANPASYVIEVYAKSTVSMFKSSLPAVVNVVRLASPESFSINHTPLEQSATTITFTPSEYSLNHTITSEYVEVGIIDNESFKITESKKNTNYVIIEVMANGYIQDGVYYLDSLEPLTINIKRMNVPTNFYISDNVAYWQGSASSYAISLDGEIITTADNFYPLDVSTGVHNLKVRAVGNSEIISSAFTSNLEITKLKTPTNLAINNKVLTWSGPNEHCVVMVDDVKYKASKSFDLSDINILTTGTTITVQAMGDANCLLDSNVSDKLLITKLDSPTNLSLYNDTIRWNQSQNSPVGYRVYQNGMLICEISNNMISSEIFKDAGIYNVQIQAIGNQITTFDSDLSIQVTFIKLAPISVYQIDDKKIVFTPVDNSCGYEIKVKETSYFITKSVSEFILPSTYDKVLIRVLGDDSKNIIKSEWIEIK